MMEETEGSSFQANTSFTYLAALARSSCWHRGPAIFCENITTNNTSNTANDNLPALRSSKGVKVKHEDYQCAS